MSTSNVRLINDNYKEIIASLEEFVYFDNTLTDQIQNWAENSINRFNFEIYKNNDNKNSTTKTLEHPLHHTTLYNEYCLLFEEVISSFLSNQNISLHELMDCFSYEMSINRKQQYDSSCVSMLTSYIDFDAFCEMMIQVKQGHGVIFCPPLIQCEISNIAEDKLYNNSSDTYNSCSDIPKHNTECKYNDNKEDMSAKSVYDHK